MVIIDLLPSYIMLVEVTFEKLSFNCFAIRHLFRFLLRLLSAFFPFLGLE